MKRNHFIIGILFIITILGIRCSILNNKNKNIKLIKRGKKILIFPRNEMCCKPYNYMPFSPPSFGVINGNILVLDVSGNPNFILIDLKKNKYKKICEFGIEPGKSFYIPTGLTISDKNEIIIGDIVRRINIYNNNGNFKESYIFPANFGGNWIVRRYRNYIIKAGKDLQIIDLKTGEIKIIFELNCKDIENIKHKTPDGVNMRAIYFDVTPEGNIIASKAIEPYVYEYSLEGELVHKYETIPSHYVSYLQIDSYQKGDQLTRKEWVGEQKYWLDKWSYSGCPKVYKTDYFVIPRRNRPPLYLDFYSIKAKKYVGYYKIDDQPFLYADDKYIYLYKESKDNELVIEKYEAIFSKISKICKEKANILEQSTFTFLKIEEFKEPDDKSIIHKKEYKKVESLTSIKNFKIIGLDEKKYKVFDYLNKDKKYHFLIIVRAMFDCPFSKLREKTKKFCDKNENFDYYYIITHPYKEELKRSIKFFRYDIEPIFNLEPERMLGFYPESIGFWYPNTTISLVDNEGNVICHLEDLREDFFEKVKQKLNLEEKEETEDSE